MTVLDAHLALIEYGLLIDPSLQDASRAHESAAACLYQLYKAAPSIVAPSFAYKIDRLLGFLSSSLYTVRRPISECLGITSLALSLDV